MNDEAKFLDWRRWDLSAADARVLQRGGWLTADHFNFAFGVLCGHPEGALLHACFGFVNPLTVMMLRYGDAATAASVVEVSQGRGAGGAWGAWGVWGRASLFDGGELFRGSFLSESE
jgi:hypothetical protein